MTIMIGKFSRQELIFVIECTNLEKISSYNKDILIFYLFVLFLNVDKTIYLIGNIKTILGVSKVR